MISFYTILFLSEHFIWLYVMIPDLGRDFCQFLEASFNELNSVFPVPMSALLMFTLYCYCSLPFIVHWPSITVQDIQLVSPWWCELCYDWVGFSTFSMQPTSYYPRCSASWYCDFMFIRIYFSTSFIQRWKLTFLTLGSGLVIWCGKSFCLCLAFIG